MTPLYVIGVILLQGILINCEDFSCETIQDENNLEVAPIFIDEPFILPSNDIEPEAIVEDFENGPQDFYDILFGSNGKFTGRSATMMEEVTSNKNMPPEEQIEEIKRVANKISNCIETEMINFLSYITANFDKTEECGGRNKRETESPMDCFKRVVRLLNHIKCTNERQNDAIEKMMTAQEIADKFNIEFNPDPEIFDEIASAAQSKSDDIDAILHEVNKANATETTPAEHCQIHYFHSNGDQVTEKAPVKGDEPIFVHVPPQHLDCQCTYTFPTCETQVRPPPHYHPQYPVSHRPPPPFYAPPTYTPAPQYTPAPYHPHHEEVPYVVEIEIVEPVCPEQEEPEPELVGEEIEETLTSKVFVGKGEEPDPESKNQTPAEEENKEKIDDNDA